MTLAANLHSLSLSCAQSLYANLKLACSHQLPIAAVHRQQCRDEMSDGKMAQLNLWRVKEISAGQESLNGKMERERVRVKGRERETEKEREIEGGNTIAQHCLSLMHFHVYEVFHVCPRHCY